MSAHSLNSTGNAITPNLITIKGESHEDLVKVQRDGSVIYGEGVDLDEAARRFWDAIAANIPPTHRTGAGNPA